MSFRDFPLTPTTVDPPVFSIAGHEFKALAEPPGGALADYFWTFGSDIEVKAAGLVRFIAACLPDEAAEEFDLVIHSKETIVPLRLLHEIVTWLMEEYAGRPTTPSSGSGSGSAETSATSEGGASSPESTPAALD